MVRTPDRHLTLFTDVLLGRSAGDTGWPDRRGRLYCRRRSWRSGRVGRRGCRAGRSAQKDTGAHRFVKFELARDGHGAAGQWVVREQHRFTTSGAITACCPFVSSNHQSKHTEVCAGEQPAHLRRSAALGRPFCTGLGDSTEQGL